MRSKSVSTEDLDFLECVFGSLIASKRGAVVSTLRRKDLRPYQKWMAREVVELEAVLLAVDMGMGKTGSVLTAIRFLIDETTIERVLVVAPKRVATDTWPDEIELWEHTRVLKYSVIAGTPEARKRALAKDVDIHIINRENLPWLWRTVKGKKGWKWDMLVYDESSRLKGWSKRTAGRKRLSEFGVLANARPLIDKVVEMTGTPAPNGLVDLGGQAYILDLGERLGSEKEAFLARWFIQNKYEYKTEPREYALDEIMDRMSDIMVSLKSEDYIDVPERIFNDIFIDLPPKAMREYNRFERTLVSEIYDVEAVSRGVLANKLLQFANGSMYRNYEDGSRIDVPIHDAKIPALESVIEEAAGNNVLIAYSFKFDLDRIKKRYPQAVIYDEEPNFVQKWKRGEINIGLAHPGSIGHGLNLQDGGHIQCWYGLTNNKEWYDQFNMRLARGDQPFPVMIHRILARNTADEDACHSLHRKGATEDAVLDAVMVRLKSLR